MKIEIVPISRNAQKPPRRAFWGEEIKGGEQVLPAGTELIHVSVMGKIKAFAPVVTCFSFENPAFPGHIYICRLLEPVKATIVDEVEARIDLGEAQDKVEIFYIGYSRPSKLRVVDIYGRTYWTARQYYILHPEYKELGKRWNRLEKERLEKIVEKRPDFYRLERCK